MNLIRFSWSRESFRLRTQGFGLSREKLIQTIREKLEDLNKKLPLLSVVLFGSYAKGNYTVASDMDLLVVHRGKERKDAYATIKRTLGVPRLEPHVYSDSEYEKMKKTIKAK